MGSKKVHSFDDLSSRKHFWENPGAGSNRGWGELRKSKRERRAVKSRRTGDQDPSSPHGGVILDSADLKIDCRSQATVAGRERMGIGELNRFHYKINTLETELFHRD